MRFTLHLCALACAAAQGPTTAPMAAPSPAPTAPRAPTALPTKAPTRTSRLEPASLGGFLGSGLKSFSPLDRATRPTPAPVATPAPSTATPAATPAPTRAPTPSPSFAPSVAAAGSSSKKKSSKRDARDATILAATVSVSCILVFLVCLRGLFGLFFQGWKPPDLGAERQGALEPGNDGANAAARGTRGAVGTTYYDERRGLFFGTIAAATIFNFVALIFAYWASTDDAKMVQVFGFARIQFTSRTNFCVVGLKGYVLTAPEVGTKFIPFDDSYGDGYKDYGWTNKCDRSGKAAMGILPFAFALKIVGALIIWRRIYTAHDNAAVKFAGVMVEATSALVLFAVLLDFSLECLTDLPTNKMTILDDEYDKATYAPAFAGQAGADAASANPSAHSQPAHM